MQATALQDYQNLTNVAAMIFGEGNQSSSAVSADEPVQTKGELQMAFKSVFG